VAHTNAPEWLMIGRSFDVPLMVFVSAMCANSLRGGVFSYAKKRLKRIYTPVFIFLTLYFVAFGTFALVAHKHPIGWKNVIGSYLLLNQPSIGYVWIMRVFLMISLILPFVKRGIDRLNIAWTVTIALSIIIVQHYLVVVCSSIPNYVARFIFEETVLYLVGFIPIVILGIKILHFSRKELILNIGLLAGLIGTYIYVTNTPFTPQKYKYPPQSLYILYGMLGCLVLWTLKPVLQRVTNYRMIRWFSEKSMWIYLWHIVSVTMVPYLGIFQDLWVGRFLFVLITAVLLTLAYDGVVSLLPKKFDSIANC